MNNLIFNNNYTETRSSANNKKKKIDFLKLKNNTCNSLYEVEGFLTNFHHFMNYIKLYKILK